MAWIGRMPRPVDKLAAMVLNLALGPSSPCKGLLAHDTMEPFAAEPFLFSPDRELEIVEGAGESDRAGGNVNQLPIGSPRLRVALISLLYAV